MNVSTRTAVYPIDEQVGQPASRCRGMKHDWLTDRPMLPVCHTIAKQKDTIRVMCIFVGRSESRPHPRSTPIFGCAGRQEVDRRLCSVGVERRQQPRRLSPSKSAVSSRQRIGPSLAGLQTNRSERPPSCDTIQPSTAPLREFGTSSVSWSIESNAAGILSSVSITASPLSTAACPFKTMSPDSSVNVFE